MQIREILNEMLSPQLLNSLLAATYETLFMTLISGFVALLIGGPLAVWLYAAKAGRPWANTCVYHILDTIINVGRSFPFFILMIALIPFTRLIVGTSIGTNAATLSLTIAAIPFIARLIENAFNEVSPGLLEAVAAMGATPLQIFRKVLIPEALPGIVNALIITLIALIGYSAMAGAIGGGGLGAMAYHYGYQRFDTTVMTSTIIVLILLVQIIQAIGNIVVARMLEKRL